MFGMDPLVSVIIANYNNARFLRQCLDSVLEQTYKRIEIVIADDVSTDQSRDVITEYAKIHSNIVPVLNARNLGVAANRINAVKIAKGEYLTTLDSDDFYYSKEKLAREIGLILQNPTGSNSLVAYSDTILVNEHGNVLRNQMQDKQKKQGEILQFLIMRSCVIPRDMTFRRDDFEAVGGYDESLSLYEDWDLKLRLAARCQYFYTGVAGTAYRVNTAGLSAGNYLHHAKLMHEVFLKNLPLLKKHKVWAAFRFYHDVLRMIARNSITRILKRGR